MMHEAQHHGFKAFHCRHDSMGYIYNRYAVPPYLRAQAIAERF